MNPTDPSKPTVLWWGRFNPNYARNRLLMRLFGQLGWQVTTFHPLVSRLGYWQARLMRLPRVTLVWVPAFRQRDLAAALAWAAAVGRPVVADPLISAYDKAVGERHKYPPQSRAAERLRLWEGRLLAACSAVVADTEAHAAYFSETLGVPRAKLHVIALGAESDLFTPQPLPASSDRPPEALFFGSFIGLQRPETIVAAAAHYRGPPARWTLLGDGPLKNECLVLARRTPIPSQLTLTFEPPLPYPALAQRVAQAHAVLGIFGASAKAARVIPNKVMQGLALGRPVVTRASAAYPYPLGNAPAAESGLLWVPPESPAALAATLADLWRSPEAFAPLGARAAQTFARYFSEATIRQQLQALLADLGVAPSSGHTSAP